MNQSLCEHCYNREDDNLVFNGSRYVKQEICVYDMQNFPKRQHCDKFEPEANDAPLAA